MDVLLVLNDIGIRSEFKGNGRKSSTFNRKADIDRLFALYGDLKKSPRIGYFNNISFINE